MKFIVYRSIKITLGVIVSIAIAQILGLEYTLSAGIITLLSMLDIKRNSPKIALKRIYTGFIALAIAAIIFLIIDFSLFSFGVFLIIYIPIIFSLNANVGLVVNTVLVTHLFSLHEITGAGLLNEVLLMFIGISMALLFNVHMPNIEKNIRKIQFDLEDQLRDVLRKMGCNLKNSCEIDSENITLLDVKKTLKNGKEKAYDYMNSYYLRDNSYFVEYFHMRKRQYYSLVYMQKHFKTEFVTDKEAKLLGDFTNKLADEFHECNSGEELLVRLSMLKQLFKSSLLPLSRREFENRASLYQYLNDLEEFISIKKDFVEDNGEIKYCNI